MAIRPPPKLTKMNQLRIKDNSPRDKAAFAPIQALADRVAGKTLAQLEREGVFLFPPRVEDTADLEPDQMILQSVNDTYRTGSVMGFVGCGDQRLVIGSRFCGDGEDYFFPYLLAKVLDLPNAVDLAADSGEEAQLFQILPFLFPHVLRTAMRKGPFKTDIRRRYNDGSVHETVDVPRHIEKNTPFVGKVAYSQREFSFGNPRMELVRHTIESIKRKPYGRRLLAPVRDEVRLVVRATPGYDPGARQNILAQNLQNPVRHAYFKEYLALQRLCLLILRHRKAPIGLGSRQIYGILFDGAWLWEEYLNTLIRDDLQVLAYMFRFDTKTGYCLYPEAADMEDQTLRMNRGSTYENNVAPREDIRLTKHGLKNPMDAPSYTAFSAKMEHSEQEFLRTLTR